jgi:arsenate reductase-like glutaredoxin family protein
MPAVGALVSAAVSGRETVDREASLALDMSDAVTAAAADSVNAAMIAAFRRKLIIAQNRAVIGQKRRL